MRELRMKGGGEAVSLADQNRKAFAAGQDFDLRADFSDARGADEDHFERPAGETGGFGEDGRVDLAAVGVALDHRVENMEAALRGLAHFARQQNGAGTGAEDRPRGSEVFE